MQMRDNDYRYVEKLLYEQKTHDSIIAELDAELEEMMPAYSSSVVKFNHDEGMVGGSQPEEWAIIRNESVRAKEVHGEIRRRRRAKAAISEAMQSLNETESQFVFLRYQQENSHSHCSRALGLWDKKRHGPSNTYWRMRKRLLGKIGRFVLC